MGTVSVVDTGHRKKKRKRTALQKYISEKVKEQEEVSTYDYQKNNRNTLCGCVQVNVAQACSSKPKLLVDGLCSSSTYAFEICTDSDISYPDQ